MDTNKTSDTRPWVGGVLLIGLGLLLLVGQWFSYSGWIVLGAIAGFFLAMWAATRAYGFMIPGFIFSGLAVGVAFEEGNIETNGGAVVLGLAAAFLGMYFVNYVIGRPQLWWPLVPGTILATVGGSLVLGGTQAGAFIALAWPVGLIAAGVLVLVARRPFTAPKT